MLSASAHGLATMDLVSGRTLDVWYPAPALNADPAPVEGLPEEESVDDLRGVRVAPVTTVVDDLTAPPSGPVDAYLRLHLLSHRLVRPHGLNMDGIFGVLA